MKSLRLCLRAGPRTLSAVPVLALAAAALQLAACSSTPTAPHASDAPKAGAALSAPVTPATPASAPLIAQQFDPAHGGRGATVSGFDATSPSAAPLMAWDRFFTEPRLQALIRLALEHNRDLRAAALNVEQARAQAVIREADLWPSVNLGVGGVRVPTNTGGVSTTVTGGLAVTAYEIDLFGRVRQQASAAQAQLQASEFLQAAARASLIAAVASAYANLQADEALMSVTQDTLSGREENLKIVQGRVRSGAASALELVQAESLLQAARAALAQVQRQRALDESALVLLVGRPLPSDLPAPLAMPLPARGTNAAAIGPTGGINAGVLSAGLPSEVLAQRPDIAAAEAQLRAAQANVEAARRALFPRISLTASYGQASKELSSLFSGGNWVWGVAPQLLAPIFDAGRLRAGVQQAQAQRQTALAQYEKSVQVAFKEVNDALVARTTLSDQGQALQAQVRAEAQRVELAQLRWRLGASAYLEVLDAQRSLYAAQTALIQAQAGIAQNQASLYKVLGGGAR